MSEPMARRAILIVDSGDVVAYRTLFTATQMACVQEAVEGQPSIHDWVSAALQRFLREDEAEIESLVGGISYRPAKEKIAWSFRIKSGDLAIVKRLAKQHNSTIQSVLSMCLFMHAIAPTSLVFPSESDIPAEETFESILGDPPQS